MIYGWKGLFWLGIASDLAQLSLRVARHSPGHTGRTADRCTRCRQIGNVDL